MTRQISPDGLAKIEQWEGCELTPYQDGAGVWTDGYGNTHGVIPHGPPITQAQAEADLAVNLASAESSVDTLVTVPLSDNQFAALVSFTYNEGSGAFASSTLLRLLNAGQYDAVPAQLARWNKLKVDGALVVSPGLANRRANEAALWGAPEQAV